MNLVVNGQPEQVPGRPTVADLLAQLKLPQKGVAVEVNGQIQLIPEATTVNGQSVPDSARRLSVFIQRRLWTSTNPRGSAWSTTKTIEMPAASDVVEFELPPLEGDAYTGHKLSLRLRVSQ